MRLLHHMPSRSLTTAVLAVAIVAATLATAGLLSRTTLAITLVAATLLNGMYTAQGKVMDNDVLLTLCLVAFVGSRHGDTWSLDAWRARRCDARWILYAASDEQGRNAAAPWIADHDLLAHVAAWACCRRSCCSSSCC